MDETASGDNLNRPEPEELEHHHSLEPTGPEEEAASSSKEEEEPTTPPQVEARKPARSRMLNEKKIRKATKVTHTRVPTQNVNLEGDPG